MASQGKNQISVQIPGEKNTQQILATLGNTAQLLFRPALCYAPPFTRGQGQDAVDRSAAHLLVGHPADRGQPAGDPRLEQRQRLHQQHQHPGGPARSRTYKSTSPLNDNKNDTVLLPGTAAERIGPRTCSGPAQLTGTAVKSASAQLNNGQWAVNLILTGAGLHGLGHPGQAAVPRHHRPSTSTVR